MKRITLVLVLGVFCMSAGCASVLSSALTIGSGALIATDWREGMKSVDYRDTLKVEFPQVWEAALMATEELGIEILEKTLDEEKKSGIITAKTSVHKKIQIIVGSVTPSVTNVGIKARHRELFGNPISARDVDTLFAAQIATGIREQCRNQTVVAKKPPVKRKLLFLVIIKKSNVRDANNKHAKIVFIASKGTKVQKLAKSGNWFKVLLPNSKKGFVYKTMVRPEIPSQKKTEGI